MFEQENELNLSSNTMELSIYAREVKHYNGI